MTSKKKMNKINFSQTNFHRLSRINVPQKVEISDVIAEPPDFIPNLKDYEFIMDFSPALHIDKNDGNLDVHHSEIEFS